MRWWRWDRCADCANGVLGNWIGEFEVNVIAPLDYGTITANYECPTDENCEDGA